MAPHGQFEIRDDGSMTTSSSVPAARHAHLFNDVQSKRVMHLPSDKTNF